MASAPTLDTQSFINRLKYLYSSWKDENNEYLGSLDAIAIVNGRFSNVSYCKTISSQIWFFNTELEDTILFITKSSLSFYTSKKKIEYLKPIEKALKDIKFNTYIKEPNSFDEKIASTILENVSSGDSVGVFTKDTPTTEFSKGFLEVMKKKEFKLVDMSLGFSLLWMKKMDDEIETTRDACRVACNLFSKFYKGYIVDNVDADKRPKHVRITNACRDAINKPNINEGKDPLDFCYEPIVQSGANVSLKLSIESNSENLYYGAIIAAFGIRYKNYCSNLIRTMFVDPTPDQTAAYNYLNETMDYAISLAKVGAKLNDIYSSIQKKITNEKPNYAEKLTKSFGFVTGIEFRDSNLLVSPKSTVSLTHNSILNLNIGFQGLSNSSGSKKEDKTFSIWLGDIVHVTNDGPVVLTASAKRRFESVSLLIKDQSESEEEEKPSKSPTKSPKKSPEKILGRGHRKAIVEQKTRNETINEDKRAERRRELFHSMVKESEQRLSGIKTGTESTAKVRSKVSYKGFGQLPNENDVKRLYVYVDKKYETVIFPILGQPCPLHVSTIKNVSVSVEGQYTFLRVNLHIPKNIILSKDSNSPNPNSVFIKELTLRALNEKRPGEVSTPATNINNACRIIKEALKKFRSKEAEERERADLIEQDELQVSQPKGSFRLKDLFVRPNISTRRITGCLEAHSNGYRFISTNGDRIDILYNNIKHAFYQPCDGEMIILLHFHLKNAIMYAKKKQLDIQFYSEVGDLTTDLGKVHSRMHDRDDLESEQREREMREEFKKAFKTFVERSENLAKKYRLDFESPFRDLGFHGCPFRSTVFLMPTSSCLISLVEMPFMAITLSEVEFVMFERVSQAVRTFDMVFIFKDYSKKVLQVNSIPTTSYELIKEWLISCDIYYAEGSKSLNWGKIMKTITDNPEEFVSEGGWSFICPEEESDEEEGMDEDEIDDNYCPTSESDEDGSGDDSSSGSDDGTGGSSDSEDWDAEQDSEEGSLDSDESEGLDWDELEKRAINEDNRRDNEVLVKGSKRIRTPSPKSKSKKARR